MENEEWEFLLHSFVSQTSTAFQVSAPFFCLSCEHKEKITHPSSGCLCKEFLHLHQMTQIVQGKGLLSVSVPRSLLAHTAWADSRHPQHPCVAFDRPTAPLFACVFSVVLLMTMSLVFIYRFPLSFKFREQWKGTKVGIVVRHMRAAISSSVRTK